MVEHQQLFDTLVADAVLTGQDQRVGEELLTDRADQLPLDVLDWDLKIRDMITFFFLIYLKLLFHSDVSPFMSCCQHFTRMIKLKEHRAVLKSSRGISFFFYIFIACKQLNSGNLLKQRSAFLDVFQSSSLSFYF